MRDRRCAPGIIQIRSLALLRPPERTLGTPESTIEPHPRDRVITVFGRKPVLEALLDPTLAIDKLFLANGSRGDTIAEILKLAGERGIRVERRSVDEVARISRDSHHDQGIAMDVVAPRMQALTTWLETATGPLKRQTHRILVLDGVSNPQNVGMILRTAVAFGLDGVVLPRKGSPEVGPYVIKASAGVAFRAPILRTETATLAAEVLKKGGFRLLGLRAGTGTALGETPLPTRVAFVLGNETEGLSAEVEGWVDGWCHIPMAGPAESLNVAVAAAIVGYVLAGAKGSP
jgi:23S rRNA (guanosine2251-2'-O)-methyltransferase